MGETVETVMISGSNGPVRVNKSDYEADQSDNGAKSMKLISATAERKEIEKQVTNAPMQPQTAGNVQLPVNPDFPPQPSPSAPDFIDPATPSTPSPNQRFVLKEGKKYVIVDGQGQKLEMDGIDPKGYAAESEAWAAIKVLPH